MMNVQEYVNTYATFTNIVIGAVAVVLCCGSGLVCMRRNRRDLEVSRAMSSDNIITL
jgi:hypothetical protein